MTGPEIDTSGKDLWTTAVAETLRAYQGQPATIEVAVVGPAKGEVSTYHVILTPGHAPQFYAGAGPGPAEASVELAAKEAEAQRRGELVAVVGYMRGSLKTKGATRPLYEFFRTLA